MFQLSPMAMNFGSWMKSQIQTAKMSLCYKNKVGLVVMIVVGIGKSDASLVPLWNMYGQGTAFWELGLYLFNK